MELLVDQEFFRDVNIHNTAYLPTKLSLYFEKHHIFEIIYDLMLLLDRFRPVDIALFVAEHIEEVAEKYKRIDTFIAVPDTFDVDAFAHLHCLATCPVLQFTKRITKASVERIFQQLERLRWTKKHLIIIGDRDSPIQKYHHFQQQLDVTDKKLRSEAKLRQLSATIRERVQLLQVDPRHVAVKYTERILFLGRPGCGRHRLARWLAQLLNINLVSITDLIHTHRKDERSEFHKPLQQARQLGNAHTSDLISSLLQRKLLHPDCLRVGWVLVDFPNTAEDVDNCFELMMTPRKVVFINTDEATCRRRKTEQRTTPKARKPLWDQMVLETELLFYDAHEEPLRRALRSKDCAILDVNGNQPLFQIQREILNKLSFT